MKKRHRYPINICVLIWEIKPDDVFKTHDDEIIPIPMVTEQDMEHNGWPALASLKGTVQSL